MKTKIRWEINNDTITFNNSFNQPLSKKILKLFKNIKNINFGSSFDKDISYLPDHIEILRFSYNKYYQLFCEFNQPIYKLPISLKTIEFSYFFNQPIGKNNISYLPNGIKKIFFGFSFNQPVLGLLPESVEYLEFGDKFQQILGTENLKLPKNLKKIKFIHSDFNFELKYLPDDLEKIVLDYYCEYNNPLNYLPKGLKKLKIIDGYKFNHPLDLLPNGLEHLELTVCKNYTHNLDNLPINLKKLKLYDNFCQPIDFLPFNLQSLTIEISTYYAYSFDNLPTNLKKLKIIHTIGSASPLKLNNLPNKLEILILGPNFYGELNNLPKNLRKILIKTNYDIDNEFIETCKHILELNGPYWD